MQAARMDTFVCWGRPVLRAHSIGMVLWVCAELLQGGTKKASGIAVTFVFQLQQERRHRQHPAAASRKCMSTPNSTATCTHTHIQTHTAHKVCTDIHRLQGQIANTNTVPERIETHLICSLPIRTLTTHTQTHALKRALAHVHAPIHQTSGSYLLGRCITQAQASAEGLMRQQMEACPCVPDPPKHQSKQSSAMEGGASLCGCFRDKLQHLGFPLACAPLPAAFAAPTRPQ